MRNIRTQRVRQALLYVALVTAGALGASAADAAQVGTYVSNYSALSGNTNFSGYNFTTDPFSNIFYGSGGAFNYTACRADSPCPHTNDSGAGADGATSAFSLATMSDVDQGGPSSGGGFARADLATGELGASSDGTYRAAFGVGSGISTRAFATLNDTVLFTIDGANASTSTDITVNVELHGMMSQVNPFTGGYTTSYLNFGGGVFGGTLRFGADGAPELAGGANYWQSYTITQLADGLAFSGVYALRGATTSIDVGQYLDVSCGNGATCDFGHTSHFSFDLPENVTFTSASGVFLTQAPAPGVPEPRTWALMILGFGGMGQALRGRRSRVVG